jgi:N-methylhydantoinase A/oxoprolinase/acetone carboxylase beta subunit
MSYRLGVDVGGTFTDLVLVSPDGVARACKVLSTVEDPACIRRVTGRVTDAGSLRRRGSAQRHERPLRMLIEREANASDVL